MKHLFLTTIAVSSSAAFVNFLGTILLVRWFGAVVYADYLVDLTYVSLLLVLLEIVPSNYSLFRIQDDPALIRGIRALAVAGALGLLGITRMVGSLFDVFHAKSVWIALYAGSMAIKRYLDIRLQSAGRLREFFEIELRGAVIRIVLLAVFLRWRLRSVDAVWASLAGAVLVAQLSWFVQHLDEARSFMSVFNRSVWLPLVRERRRYIPYYTGSAVKRLRDNLVPLLADCFFIDRETMGAFLLAYRGLLFTLGQLRIVEGMLNHRDTLAVVMGLPFSQRVFVAAVGQLICILVSVIFIFASGIELPLIAPTVLLSVIVWPYIFSTAQRAEAYSSYDTLRVNSAMVTYCVSAGGFAWLFLSLHLRTPSAFSVILIGAEGLSLWMMFLLARVHISGKKKWLGVEAS